MIRHGDCLEILPTLPAESIDAIVTDPPYALTGASRGGSQRNAGTGPFGRHTLGTKPKGGFMGKEWDASLPSPEIWSEALRVAKPGAHLLAFGGTRTFHRLTCAIEDAGWEIRDCIMWVYGSGFPKSHDVSKAIDREAGAERTKLGINPNSRGDNRDSGGWKRPWQADPEAAAKMITAPATPAAQQWQGRGTALKPAWEPIIVARKPLVGTVAENVLAHGAGALNIDGCRVGDFQNTTPSGVDRRNAALAEAGYRPGTYQMGEKRPDTPPGRWPANLIHDGSDEVLALAGDAARFFYCAKASKRDRGEGNTHPTVKPTALMRYLCRLVTPPGGTVLDPFCGSGSTGKAATLEGFNFIGIEREAEYVEIARARIAAVQADMPLLVNA